MVLQNANNQLFAPIPRLKSAKFPNVTGKNTPKSFRKSAKSTVFSFFERKNVKTDLINGEKHALTFTSKNSVKYLRLRPTGLVL